MKRALIAAVLVLAVAFAGGTLAFANDMHGKVKSIEVNQRVITLEDGTQYYWTESVTVSKDIKAGSQVRATYEPRDGKMMLTRIEIVK